MADDQSQAPGAGEEAPAQDPNTINLRVASQEGGEVFFKIKRNTPLRKLMDAYCARQAVDSSAIRFLYDGQRLQPDQTPAQLEMNNDDLIDAVLQQVLDPMVCANNCSDWWSMKASFPVL